MTDKEQRTLDYLKGYISVNKQQLIDKALDQRTRHLAVVLDDIYQPQNASAAIRTADCFGIQEVYVIENKHKFKVNPRVVHGSSKWVNVTRFNEEADNVKACVTQLKEQGYRLLATVPDPSATSIYDIDISQKTALVFGTEMSGISPGMMEHVEGEVTIPMYGFTESFNISVSVAIILSRLAEKLFSSNIDWKLNEDEKSLLKLEWYRKIVNRSNLLEKEFLKTL